MPVDFEERVLDKLDNCDANIRDLCDRITRIEERMANHLEMSNNATISNRQKFYFVLGFIGTFLAGLFTNIVNG
jgi:hypothetical protein